MEENIVIVKCGAEVGTAFYISRNYLLTAYHVICDYAHSHNNYLLSKTSKTDYSIEKEWEEYDLALIKVEDREEESCLPLLSKSVRIGETIRSYGYPDVECNEGLWAKGEVAQRLVDGCADYSISVVNVDRNYDYAGLSGAPILYDNFVIGIAIEQTGDCINFVSIRKIETDLRSLAIQVNKERNLVSIPESIKAELEKCRPNYTAFNDIENALSRTDGNWIVLYGNPGCGKTTISAGFESNDETFEVIGRFFFKVPNDTTSLAERKSLNYFINWIESIDNGTWSQYEAPFYSVIIENVPIEMIPAWLVDSLIIAFEKELPLATESDRYQKHSEQGDTLSYTLAYNGTINPTNTQSRLNVMNHHYSQSITAAAALDIENKTLRFHYNKIGKVNGRIWVPTSVHHGTLLEIFNEIAQESQSKVVSVSYNINDGNGNGNWEYMNSHYGYVHRHGRRVEVPKDKANDYFQRLFAAFIEAGQTQDFFSCSLSRNDANIVFGKQWDGDVFCLRRLKDGRVFVLHIEKPDKPCDLAIPYNWHEVDSISRLKE